MALDVEDKNAILSYVRDEGINFVIIGPEAPLSEGLTDVLEDADIPVYGPSQQAAQLESSKHFSKAFMERHAIPTARSKSFTNYEEARNYLRHIEHYPVVIKASGLAAGKGVVIAEAYDKAKHAIRAMLLEDAFGMSGKTVLIEDFLEGEEASVTVMVSGKNYVVLPCSQDHKRVGDQDAGPNTGGMGAYAPADIVTPKLQQTIESTVIQPTIHGLADEGIHFRGTLYIGLMLTDEGTYVLEYNVRLGDPETQVLLPLIHGDPIELMYKCATDRLETQTLEPVPGYVMTVVVAAQGYPDTYTKGEPIKLPENEAHAWILHAGTTRDENKNLLSNGGRVLSVIGQGSTLAEASEQAYQQIKKIEYPSKYYRRDIGWRQLARSGS